MIKICFCHIDWAAVSAISNMIIALIALATLIYSFYLLFREKNRRKEDLRARLDCSLIKYMNAYYLLIENVGKEAAYDISITVKGKVIDEGLYEYVRDTFSKLEKTPLIMKGGEKKYFFICPDRMERNVRYKWRQKETIDDINKWVTLHENDEIKVSAQYNKRYNLSCNFSIKNFDFIGSTKILDPIEQISGVISDMDTYTLDEIKQALTDIADKLETLKDRERK
jgi:hypothetical protein